VSWNTEILFTESELKMLEGELLDGLVGFCRHNFVKEQLLLKIKNRFPHISDVASKIDNAQAFKTAAMSLDLAIVLGENSLAEDDIFAHKSKLYRTEFETQFEESIMALKLDDTTCEVELVR
jgi:hypothetical protein